MRHDARQFPRYGTIDVFHDAEIGGEENVEEALMDLQFRLVSVCAFLSRGFASTHQRRPHRHHPPLIPRLHDWRIHARDGVGQGVEVARHEAVRGEVLAQDVEEVHQARGDILRFRQVRGERQLVLQVSEDSRGAQGVVVVAVDAGGVADAQVACGDWIEGFAVELEKVAVVVDEGGALQGFFGLGVVSDDVVGEIVEDFEGEEETRVADVLVPVEDALVHYGDLVCVTEGFGRAQELVCLD